MRNTINYDQYIQGPQMDISRSKPYRFKYTDQNESNIRRYHQPNMEKENSIRSTNLTKLSPSYLEQNHIKSTSSTNQQTHPKTSTDNLHALRLQSQILELQKTLDQQQFEIETLTEEASHFMKLCDDQKQILIGLNIEGMRSQYQEQIQELLTERHKVEDIIMQLQDDYNQVYAKEEAELNSLRERNNQIYKQIEQELERKKSILSLLAAKDKQLMELEIDLRESDERIDELRNIERKLTIALRELEMLREKKACSIKNLGPKTRLEKIEQHLTPQRHKKGQERSAEKRGSHSKYKYDYTLE